MPVKIPRNVSRLIMLVWQEMEILERWAGILEIPWKQRKKEHNSHTTLGVSTNNGSEMKSF